MSQEDRYSVFSAAIRAGLLYFAGVFALGFLFGGIRMMLLEPTLGDSLAVLVELPLILVLSWILCRRSIVRFQVSALWSARLLMGGVALAILLVAEFLLATLLFAESPGQFLGSLLTAAGLLGLGGQIVFALFPLLQSLRSTESGTTQSP